MKKTFEIEVVETLSRVVTVEADSLADAIEKGHQLYDSEEIVLDAADFNGHSVVAYNGGDL